MTVLRATQGNRLALAGSALALGLLGAVLLVSAPARGANACPGRNGEIAVSNSGPSKNVIGILEPNRRLRPVYERAVGGSPETGGTSILDLSFSCDGRQIVFVENDLSDCNLLVVVTVQTGRRRQIQTPHLCAAAPAFLTGGQVVFSGSRQGANRQGGTYVVDPDGSHLRRRFARGELAASADGRWFVATDWLDDLHTLYLLDARGKLVRSLTAPPALHGSEYLNPHFSPDGRWIVYEERRFRGGIHDVLYLVRRDGTHRRRLTSGPESASEPTFSPDGRWIAFTRSKEGPWGNVFALSVRNPSRVKKLGLSYGYQYPTWGVQ